MRNKLSLLAFAAIIALAVSPAIAADTTSADVKVHTEQKDDGSYKEEVSKESKDPAGTKTTADSKVKVDVGSNGDVTKKATTTTTEDPKGLFNKRKTKIEDTAKIKDGKSTMEHKKVVNGKTVEDTKTKDAPVDADTTTSTDTNMTK